MIARLEPGSGALADYYEWFKGATHGDALVYHTGDLAFDRLPPGTPVFEDEDVPPTALSVLANRILADAKEGYLRLTQTRIATSVFEYRATRVRTALEALFQESARAEPVPA